MLRCSEIEECSVASKYLNVGGKKGLSEQSHLA